LNINQKYNFYFSDQVSNLGPGPNRTLIQDQSLMVQDSKTLTNGVTLIICDVSSRVQIIHQSILRCSNISDQFKIISFWKNFIRESSWGLNFWLKWLFITPLKFYFRQAVWVSLLIMIWADVVNSHTYILNNKVRS